MSSIEEDMLIDLTNEIVSIPTARSRGFGAPTARSVSPNPWIALRRFRLTILWATVVGIAFGLVYFSVRPRLYRSSALVSLGHDVRQLEGTSQSQLDRLDGASIPAEVKVSFVKTFALAERILGRNPDLVNQLRQSEGDFVVRQTSPNRTGTLGGVTSSLAEVSAYLSRISFVYSEHSHLISISAVASDPLVAAKMANNHSQGLIDFIAEKQIHQADGFVLENKRIEEDARNNYFTLLERERSLEEQVKNGSRDQDYQIKLQSELEVVKQSTELAKAIWEASKKKLLYVGLFNDDLKGMAIIDPAVPPLVPLNFRLIPLLCLTGIGGGLIGIILAFIREACDSSIHSVVGCAVALERPLIGLIPTISPETKRATALMANRASSERAESSSESNARVTSWLRFHMSSGKALAPLVLAAPFSSESEAIRGLAVSLATRTLHSRENIVLFTSPGSREGKSLVAVNTAIALAQMHRRVLLVDGDLRFPSIHRFFGFHRETVGLFDFSLGAMELNELLIESPTEGLMLLLSGSPAPLPTLISDHERIERGLRSLSPLFDAIIVDSPAISSVVDPLLLSRAAHSVILVVRFNQTTLRETQIALAQLDQFNANVIGLALNDIQGDRLVRYMNN